MLTTRTENGPALGRRGLDFDPEHLGRRPAPAASLSDHRTSGTDHFFTRVLNGSRLEPPNETVPDIEDFPRSGGMREHVEWALGVYRELLESDSRISPHTRSAPEQNEEL